VEAVLEPESQSIQPVGLQRGEEQRHPLDVEDRVSARDGRRQDRAGFGRRAGDVGNQHHPGESRRHRQRQGQHTVRAGAGYGEPAEQRGGDIVGVAFGARGERQQRLPAERGAEQRIAGDEAADPGGRARPQTPRRRDAVHARERASAKAAPGCLVGAANTARDHVSLVGGQTTRALAFDGDAHAVGLLGGDLVVEGQREGQGIEAWTEVGGTGGHPDADSHQAGRRPGGVTTA
jgi:hypothetical protein